VARSAQAECRSLEVYYKPDIFALAVQGQGLESSNVGEHKRLTASNEMGYGMTSGMLIMKDPNCVCMP
jgi:hypothetical protein